MRAGASGDFPGSSVRLRPRVRALLEIPCATCWLRSQEGRVLTTCPRDEIMASKLTAASAAICGRYFGKVFRANTLGRFYRNLRPRLAALAALPQTRHSDLFP